MNPIQWWRVFIRRKPGPPRDRRCRCNQTARAIEWVGANWVVQGIGRE